jgi:hypothetical protein
MLEGQWCLKDRSEGDDFENVTIGGRVSFRGPARECRANAQWRLIYCQGPEPTTDVDAGF